MLQRKHYYIAGTLCSLILHSLLLSGFWLYQNLAPLHVSIGDRQPNSIAAYPAYLSFASTPRIPSPSRRALHTRLRTNVKKAPTPLALRRSAATSRRAANNSTKAQATHLNGQQAQALLQALHLAIAQHQHYPASALALERTGRITLSFTLATTGVVSNLQIIKSSGTSSLDAAALAAVQDAAPFTQAIKYLTAAQKFNIDVVFG